MKNIMEVVLSIIMIGLGACIADSPRWMRNVSLGKNIAFIIGGALLTLTGGIFLIHFFGLI